MIIHNRTWLIDQQDLRLSKIVEVVLLAMCIILQ